MIKRERFNRTLAAGISLGEFFLRTIGMKDYDKRYFFRLIFRRGNLELVTSRKIIVGLHWEIESLPWPRRSFCLARKKKRERKRKKGTSKSIWPKYL